MINDRDLALAKLEAAGVLVRAEFVDTNGNVAYHFRGFPPGEEGKRLKTLFDQYIQRRDGPQAR